MWFLLLLVATVLVIFGIGYIISERPAPPVCFVPPDEKYCYVCPKDWKGTPVDQKGRFVNYEFPFYQNYIQVIRWLPSHVLNLLRNRGKKFPAIMHSGSEFLFKNDVLIWLGHASFYLNVNGIRILIDPQFFNASIYRRHTPTPIDPELFRNIDYVLLSHDHADHCDKKSIRILVKNNPGITFLTGLKMENLLKSFTSSPLDIHTADWYRKYTLNDPVKIYFVPSRHYCKRLGKKFNGSLWGGFVITYTSIGGHERIIYFGGDSGKSSHFVDVGELFSPDLAIIGIGAFMPGWFMHPNHMSPQNAVEAFKKSGANILIPMHYGTFNLSSEDMEIPLNELNKHKGDNNILPLTPGEILPLV